MFKHFSLNLLLPIKAEGQTLVIYLGTGLCEELGSGHRFQREAVNLNVAENIWKWNIVERVNTWTAAEVWLVVSNKPCYPGQVPFLSVKEGVVFLKFFALYYPPPPKKKCKIYRSTIVCLVCLGLSMRTVPGTVPKLRRYSLIFKNPCCPLVIRKAFFHVWSLSYFSMIFHTAGAQHSLVWNNNLVLGGGTHLTW